MNSFFLCRLFFVTVNLWKKTANFPYLHSRTFFSTFLSCRFCVGAYLKSVIHYMRSESIRMKILTPIALLVSLTVEKVASLNEKVCVMGGKLVEICKKKVWNVSKSVYNWTKILWRRICWNISYASEKQILDTCLKLHLLYVLLAHRVPNP